MSDLLTPDLSPPSARRSRSWKRLALVTFTGLVIGALVVFYFDGLPLVLHRGTILIDRQGCSAKVFSTSEVSGSHPFSTATATVPSGNGTVSVSLPAGWYEVTFYCDHPSAGDGLKVTTGQTVWAMPGPVEAIP
jgi:hypothetical protein